MPPLSRRAVICRACALAAVTGCEGFNSVPPDVPADTASPPPPAASEATEPATAYRCDAVASPDDDGWVALPLAEHPDLDALDGWVQVQVGGQTLNVAQVEPDCFVAMATACTHEGARVDYVPERKQFVCTRHGAVYVYDGTPILGPTSVPLETFPAARAGDTVWVEIG